MHDSVAAGSLAVDVVGLIIQDPCFANARMLKIGLALGATL